MKSLKLVAAGLVALVLAGCAGEPTWNTSVFPQEPTYAAGAQTAQVGK